MKALERTEAVAESYRRLRSTTDALRAAALLYALGVTLDEIDAAMKTYGDC